MRILVATDQWFPSVRGGVARLATESARRLAARGHEVTALVPAGSESTEGVRVIAALGRGRAPKTLTDPRHTARAARALGDEFDVLLAHTSTTAAGLASSGLRAPLVTFFHASAVLELDFVRSRGGARGARALRPVLAHLERQSLAGAARILILSEFTRSLLAQRDAEAAARATLVPAGVDTARFAPPSERAMHEGVELFTARRLVPRMGLEELVDAVSLLGDVDKLRLSIAGDGPLAASLAARRADERVQLLGRVPDDELIARLGDADLFVLPTVAYEGFGMATVEALATGTPVVGTPAGATPEVLGPLDERLLAEAATPEGIAAAIRRGLELLSPELRERCRAYAVARFSWEAALPAWEAELERAAESGRRPARKNALVRAARTVDKHVPVDLGAARNTLVRQGREGAGLAVRATGTASIARRVGADRRAGILLYHNPTPATLERHLTYLARRHPFVPYAVVAGAVSSGNWSDVPPKALAVTFDDGHAGNAALVPLLESFGIHATIFICTEIVGTHRQFWWTVDGLSARDRDRLMHVENAVRLAELERLAGWTPLTEAAGAPQALSHDELRALDGRVTFEAHTRLHPILTACDDERAADEIGGSKQDVERLTGRSCTAFAYPNGRYGARELELVRQAGFESARTVETGWNDPRTDPYRLRILGMPDNASLNVVAAQSTGLPVLRDLMYLS